MVRPLRTLLMCLLRRCWRTLRPAPWNALAPSGSFDVGAAGLPEVEAAGARRVQLARADMMNTQKFPAAVGYPIPPIQSTGMQRGPARRFSWRHVRKQRVSRGSGAATGSQMQASRSADPNAKGLH